ncbi:helix-turn-helix domain-containing protein [Streptomyces violascens]|uniref:helix-turn-helix domain-containing protein n=1 Tax=Streptomyces violascens TaxID=67381 RepID=UPI0036B93CF0
MSASRRARGSDAARSVSWGDTDVSRDAAARLLGTFLRDLRTQRGLSLAVVAPVIRGSVSKLSRVERGESPPKEQDVWELARYYGASAADEEEIHALLRQVRQNSRGKQFSDVTPQFLRRLIELEKSAFRIKTYENHVVPGLLQTPEYAAAVIEQALPEADDLTIRRLVQARKDRWSLFDAPQRPEVVAILDEGVLRRAVGGSRVMLGQLHSLRKRAGEATEHTSIRIIPFDQGISSAVSFPLTHLTFKDNGPSEMVYLELLDSANYVTETNRLAQYRSVMDRLEQTALHRRDSIALLDRMIGKFEQRLSASPE